MRAEVPLQISFEKQIFSHQRQTQKNCKENTENK